MDAHTHDEFKRYFSTRCRRHHDVHDATCMMGRACYTSVRVLIGHSVNQVAQYFLGTHNS